MHVFEKNIKELGITIPDLPVALANYVPYRIVDISIEDGIRAAELCCINIIAALKQGTNGNWDQLDSFVKLGGFVNSPDDFTDHPKIINGASDLLVKIFGDQGRHARFAVGSNSLPMNISVEIDAIIKIK